MTVTEWLEAWRPYSESVDSFPWEVRTSDRFWFVRVRADYRPFAAEDGYSIWRAYSIEHRAGLEGLTAHADYDDFLNAAVEDFDPSAAVTRGDATFLVRNVGTARCSRPRAVVLSYDGD